MADHRVEASRTVAVAPAVAFERLMAAPQEQVFARRFALFPAIREITDAARTDAGEPLPVIADADTGFGEEEMVRRTVIEYARAGAAALHIEDQVFPKRCGHLDGKALVPSEDMCGKIHAAVDSRRSSDTLVIARTDAVAVEGFERAIERAACYRAAGADMLFVETPKSSDQLARVVTALPGVRLMANMVEGGKTPTLPAAELEAIGFALVIFPGGIVRALAHHAAGYYASLATNGTTEPFRNQMLDFDGLNRVIGTPEMIALGRRYQHIAPAGNDNKSGKP